MKLPTTWWVMTILATALPLSANAAAPDDLSWLKPGKDFVIMPPRDGGQAVVIRKEDDGLVICAAVLSYDGVIPQKCNTALTLPGFHLPPERLFDDTSEQSVGAKLKRLFGKAGDLLWAALPAAAAVTSVPGAAQTGGAVASSTQPVKRYNENQAVHSATRSLKDICAPLDAEKIPCVATDGNNIDFLRVGIVKKVGKFSDYCKGKGKKANDPTCAKNAEGVRFAHAIMSECRIDSEPEKAGEHEGPDLWLPGQPLPKACRCQLKESHPELLAWLVTQGDDSARVSATPGKLDDCTKVGNKDDDDKGSEQTSGAGAAAPPEALRRTPDNQ